MESSYMMVTMQLMIMKRKETCPEDNPDTLGSGRTAESMDWPVFRRSCY